MRMLEINFKRFFYLHSHTHTQIHFLFFFFSSSSSSSSSNLHTHKQRSKITFFYLSKGGGENYIFFIYTCRGEKNYVHFFFYFIFILHMEGKVFYTCTNYPEQIYMQIKIKNVLLYRWKGKELFLATTLFLVCDSEPLVAAGYEDSKLVVGESV